MPTAYAMSQRKTKPVVSEDERSLFRERLGAVAPLRLPPRQRRDHLLPSTRPRSLEADEAAVLSELLDHDPEEAETGEDLSFARPGLQHGVMRRLRRGHYHCQAQLDLHGLFVSTARAEIVRFLADCHDAGHRCVRIVHGKGLGSGNRGPVLRNKVAVWLRRRDDVLAYTSARRIDGGTGAVYVLLRR